VESLAPETVAGDAGAPSETAAAPQSMAPGLAALLAGQAAEAPRHAAVVVPPKLKPAAPSRKIGMWPWVLLAGIVCGLAVAAYFFQEPISRKVPGADSIYALLGLRAEDATEQLLIGNLKSEQRSGLIAVRGDVFNPEEVPLKMPPLLLVGLDGDQKPVGKPMMFRTKEADIAPGETITFRVLYQDAPAAMKSFRVTFGKIDATEP
jgi:hypothetical protein